jgi:predicted DCC family thiol-disulfide oxidoreductase YuxK
MVDARRQEGPYHLLLYDGECGFCHAAVRFVLARDRRGVFRFVALQSAVAASELAPFGGLPSDLTTLYVIENHRGGTPALHSRAAAVWVIARSLGWPWIAITFLRVLPARWLDAAYDVVARHRHAFLGRSDACVVPLPRDRERFLDSDGAASR